MGPLPFRLIMGMRLGSGSGTLVKVPWNVESSSDAEKSDRGLVVRCALLVGRIATQHSFVWDPKQVRPARMAAEDSLTTIHISSMLRRCLSKAPSIKRRTERHLPSKANAKSHSPVRVPRKSMYGFNASGLVLGSVSQDSPGASTNRSAEKTNSRWASFKFAANLATHLALATVASIPWLPGCHVTNWTKFRRWTFASRHTRNRSS